MSTIVKLSLFLKNFLVLILSFFLPIKGVILAVGFAIVADTVTGIIKAIKTKDEITSKKLSKIVSKMILYEGAIVLIFLIESFILGDLIGLVTSMKFILTKLVALTFIGIEIKSIDENYKAMYNISIIQKIKELLLRAKELKKEISDLTKDEKKKDAE